MLWIIGNINTMLIGVLNQVFELLLVMLHNVKISGNVD